jgi:putative ABC transport system permease protein
VITPDYFRTMNIALLRGRGFTDADRDGAPDVAIVDEALAKRFWPNEDPIGKRIGHPWDSPWLTVVGVAHNVATQRIGDADSAMAVYRPLLQESALTMTVVVRSDAAAGEIGARVRRVVASIDPSVPVSDVRTMDQIISGSVSKPRFTMVLVGAFAGLALLLGAVGIYGVVSYSVTQRNREIGIRMALGAKQNDVLKLVVRRGALLAALGAAFGLVLSVAAMRGVASLLYGVEAADPATFILAPLLLVGVAVVASYIPGRRAASVDPVRALNAE